MARRTNNESQLVQEFKAMVNRRYDALPRYGIEVKPKIKKERVIQVLELMDYDSILPFFNEEQTKTILDYLEETNSLFKNLKDTKSLIDKEMRKVFKPGNYTYM